MPPSVPGPKDQVIPAGENLFKIALILALVAGSFYLADLAVDELETPLKWLLAASLGLLDVVLLTGIGVLAHDGVHRVLFRSPFWNDFWGGLVSALTLLPFQANRQFHLWHHSHAHQLGLDPEEKFHRYPLPVAFAAGATIAVVLQYGVLLNNLRQGRIWRAVQDILFIGLAAAIYFVLLPALGISVLATVVPLLLAFPLVVGFRAITDHYGLPPVQRENEQPSGRVVLVPRWLEWLWSHVNYHEVHHRYPYLSHRYLPQAFAATREREPYVVVRGYWRAFRDLSGRSYYA